MTTKRPFEEVFAELNQAFQEGEYTSVVEIAESHRDRYPEQKAMLIYLQACAAARLDRKEAALETLTRALDERFWYSERVLRDSPSLHPLVGLPEYDQLIELSAQAAAAERSETEKLMVLTPRSATPPYPLLVALHSNGSSAREAGSHWAGLLDLGWLLALPESTEAVWKGNYNWVDINKSIAAVARCHEDVSRAYQLDPERLVIGGHSMGGRLAIQSALESALPARGFIAVGPYIAEDELDSLQMAIEMCKDYSLRGAIFFGEEDDTIPQKTIYNLVEQLEAQGVEVMLRRLPGVGHEFAPAIREALPEALDFVLKHL
jgi:predicted esterase